MEDINIGINAKGAQVASSGMHKLANASKDLGGDLGKLGNAAKGLTAAFAPLLAVFAAVKSIQGLGNLIASSNEAFLVQEKAARGASDGAKAWASEMQVVLGIGDEVTLGLGRQAAALGISDDKIEEATKAAIGLSQVTGAGLDESLKKVNQAMRGNANALAEVIPGLSKLKTEEEKLAAVNELVGRGLQEQKAQMQGLEGIQTRASNSLGDLMEVFGQILAPIRAVISQGIAVFAETMQSVLAPAAAMAKEAMSQLPAIFDWVSRSIVGAITVIDVVINNLPEIFAAAIAQAELYWLQFSEGIKHTLTVVIPTYLEWFGENWYTLLTDIFSAGLTIAQNYIQNYADIILSLWDWVSSGFAGGAEKLFTNVSEIASRSLLEGFQAKTQSLPEIMERQLTEREQQLSAKVAQIGSKLGTEFSDKFTSRMDAINEKFEGFDLSSKLTQDTDAIGKLGSTSKGQAAELKAVESRLLTRGRSEDPNAKVADNTKATVSELQKMNQRQEFESNRSRSALVVEVVGA